MRLALAFLVVFALVPPLHAQRGATPLLDVTVLPEAGAPHRFRVTAIARADAEIVADVRWLHLDVRAHGSRRSLGCDSPLRPRRLDPSATRTLHAGESWSDTFDVRMICWGRALAALEAGGEIGGSLGTTRSHTGARTPGASTYRPVAIPFAPVVATTASAPPAGDVRIALSPVDATSAARMTFRVQIRAARSVRAWVRPDRIRFRVVAPDGTASTCRMERAPEAPIPDLFARIGARSGPLLSLEARAYCAAGVFTAAGIYDVTPILDLDVDGARWHFDTPVGSFEGAAVPVRVRTDGGRS